MSSGEIVLNHVTQRLIVDMPTRTVSMVLAGPVGPKGETGDPAADTGWRDINSLLLNGWIVEAGNGFIRIRRVGFIVEMVAYLDSTAATGNAILNVPTGFTPATPGGGWYVNGKTGRWLLPLDGADEKGSWLIRGNTAEMRSDVRTGGLFMRETWTTEDIWPSPLPGTAP